jgi:hypothetical protein
MGLTEREAAHILTTGRRLNNGHGSAQRRAAPRGVGISTPALEQCLAELVAKLRKEWIEPLQQRIAELEARPVSSGAKYAGVHEMGKRYDTGDLVTRSGGLWIVVATGGTHNEPGDDSGHWRLIVKRGEAEPPVSRFPTQPRSRSSNR